MSPKGAREGASWEPPGLNKRMIGVSGFDSVSACLAFSRGSLLPEAPRADSEANRLSNRGLLQFQAAPHLPGPGPSQLASTPSPSPGRRFLSNLRKETSSQL